MPKQKTKSSAKKRFKYTGTGKLMRKQVGVRHNLRKKTTKSKRMLTKKVVVTKADHSSINNMLAN